MPLNERAKNFCNFLLRIGLSVGALFIVYKIVDIDKTIEVLKSSDVSYIYYGLIVFLIINIVILFRWFIFIKALGLRTVTKLNVTRSYFIGLFGNLFLPSSIGGDILKTLGLCKETNEKAKVVASVLLDRLSGFASIILVSVGAFIFGFKYINDYMLLIPIGIMTAGAFAVAVVLFNERVYLFCCKVFGKFPRLKDNLEKLHYDIALLKDKKMEGIKGILMSCLSQTTFSFVFYLLAKALHQDVPLIYFLIFVPMICVASSVPSIGGLGVRELGAVYLFGRIGLDEGISASLSLMSFFFMVVVGLLGGVIYVSTISAGRVQHRSSDSGVVSQGA